MTNTKKYPTLADAKKLDKKLKQAMDDLLQGKITAAEGNEIAAEADHLMNSLEDYIQTLESDFELHEDKNFLGNIKRQSH